MFSSSVEGRGAKGREWARDPSAHGQNIGQPGGEFAGDHGPGLRVGIVLHLRSFMLASGTDGGRATMGAGEVVAFVFAGRMRRAGRLVLAAAVVVLFVSCGGVPVARAGYGLLAEGSQGLRGYERSDLGKGL